ncbi:MAG: hypothetical protein BWY87_00683 [Deltaproteobacteria bacterium ADurb.Bin510]|nr:MAG: hypothetical protein BWY87_00683 [Deltaproteobacteria bacterium ADurb.Bin510]
MLFFLPQPDSVVLCLPFAAMLVGLWIRQDLKLEKYARSNHLGLLLTGALLFAGSLVLLGLPAAKKFSIAFEQAVALGLIAALTLAFVVLIRGRRYHGALASVMLAALLTSAAWGLFYLPLELRSQLDYFAGLANCQPVVAFEDDLVARGYLGFVGNDPLVIKREVVPLGQPVYLTVCKPAEIKKLKEAAKACKKTSPWRFFEGPAASQAKAVSAVSFYGPKPIYGTFRFSQPYYFRS